MLDGRTKKLDVGRGRMLDGRTQRGNISRRVNLSGQAGLKLNSVGSVGKWPLGRLFSIVRMWQKLVFVQNWNYTHHFHSNKKLSGAIDIKV